MNVELFKKRLKKLSHQELLILMNKRQMNPKCDKDATQAVADEIKGRNASGMVHAYIQVYE